MVTGNYDMRYNLFISADKGKVCSHLTVDTSIERRGRPGISLTRGRTVFGVLASPPRLNLPVFLDMRAPGLFLVLLLAIASSARAASGADGQPSRSAPRTASTSISHARNLMAAAWCPKHSTSTACASYLFLQELRNCKSPEKRKELLADRQRRTTSMSTDEKAVQQAQMKRDYREMYAAYCDESSKAHFSEGCRNVILKAIYGKRGKADAARDERLRVMGIV